MAIIQVAAIIFSLFALSRVFLRAKDKKLTIPEFLFWIFIWGAFIVTAFFPDLLSVAAKFVGIGRGIDVLIYMSVATLFYLIFRLYIKLEELEQEMTLVVREMAFIKAKKKKK
ncbi:MAG: DUF2304 family protein [Nanoarchaeota archaeon]|nr:DUF2304 family protein [Nanoarchaeota archaeon]